MRAGSTDVATRGKAPDYSEILNAIAKSPAERQRVLKRYFEPTEAERFDGSKMPMAAHKAIARLVSAGFIRVIVTTNFDRLLEQALQEDGISCAVISTSDQISGMMPLAHSGPTVVKINGDYLDTRIRNTAGELAKYDKTLTRLLAQIVDEYGLLVCGWSGDWDEGLASAITRSPTRRFTTFWAVQGTPSTKAQQVIRDRRAEILTIADADSFFVSLEEKVLALAMTSAPHPASAKIAVETAKRYLRDPNCAIRLRDLVIEERERTFAALGDADFPLDSPFTSPQERAKELEIRLAKYEAALQPLLGLMITGCYWGNESHIDLWTGCIERMGNHPQLPGLVPLLKLRLYPALLLFYGGGIAALARKNYATLASLFKRPILRTESKNNHLFLSLNQLEVLNGDLPRLVPKFGKSSTPLSLHLFSQLRQAMGNLVGQDQEYEETFDRFEYLAALVHLDMRTKSNSQRFAPPGIFAWRDEHFSNAALAKCEAEIESAGDNWPPLKTGLLDGGFVRAKQVKGELHAWILQWRAMPG